jgi:histidinol-phosphate aminotransferase
MIQVVMHQARDPRWVAMASIQDSCAAREAQAASTKRLPTRELCASREVIDLSANENPLGPSPRALAAILHAAKEAHRYPDKNGMALKKELASRLGVAIEQIVLGNGSAEVIDAIARATLGPGDEAIVGSPSFPAYRSSIVRAGAAVTAVPLVDGAEDLATIAKRVSGRTRLVILANPNNPTGGTFGAASWEAFIAQMPGHVVVVVDEAYYEYVTRPDFPRAFEQVTAGQRVVVLRSFSKAYGLAGLRIGYGIAPTLLAQRIEKQVQHFNTNRLAQDAAMAALCDEDYLAHCVAMNREGRLYLHRELTALGFTVPESQANFLLVRTSNAVEVHSRLRERGVLVKLLDGFGLPDAIRVSVGGPEDNERFIEALASVRMRSERDMQDGRI